MELFRIGREHYKYVIIGVGYTGPGTTYRLAELGESDFLIIEIIGIGPNLPSDDKLQTWIMA